MNEYTNKDGTLNDTAIRTLVDTIDIVTELAMYTRYDLNKLADLLNAIEHLHVASTTNSKPRLTLVK